MIILCCEVAIHELHMYAEKREVVGGKRRARVEPKTFCVLIRSGGHKTTKPVLFELLVVVYG